MCHDSLLVVVLISTFSLFLHDIQKTLVALDLMPFVTQGFKHHPELLLIVLEAPPSRFKLDPEGDPTPDSDNSISQSWVQEFLRLLALPETLVGEAALSAILHDLTGQDLLWPRIGLVILFRLGEAKGGIHPGLHLLKFKL